MTDELLLSSGNRLTEVGLLMDLAVDLGGSGGNLGDGLDDGSGDSLDEGRGDRLHEGSGDSPEKRRCGDAHCADGGVDAAGGGVAQGHQHGNNL